MRLYEKRGRLDIARARDVPEALSFLDGLKALHQSYWTGRGEPGGFSYPFFESFQKRLIPTCLSHGTVEILRVSAGQMRSDMSTISCTAVTYTRTKPGSTTKVIRV